MAIEQLKFTKDWTNPADFPTVETDEVQVRQDLQQLHSEVRDYLNGTLLPAIEEGYVPGKRAVNGHPLTADVTLTRAEVGLGQVDNTADMDVDAPLTKILTKIITPKINNKLQKQEVNKIV